MSPSSASARVSSASRVATGLALLGAGLLWWVSGWRSAAGLVAGVGAMTAMVHLTAWRVAALLGSGPFGGARVLVVLAHMTAYLVVLGLFWLMVYVLQAPGWSLAIGITIGVVALVVGFGTRPRNEGS